MTPWPLRDDYIHLALGEVSGAELLRRHSLGHLSEPQAARLIALLEANYFRQRMYASSTFFHEALTRPEACFAIGNGAKALLLVRQAVGEDFLPSFRGDLGLAVAGDGKTGAQLLDDVLAEHSA